MNYNIHIFGSIHHPPPPIHELVCIYMYMCQSWLCSYFSYVFYIVPDFRKQYLMLHKWKYRCWMCMFTACYWCEVSQHTNQCDLQSFTNSSCTCSFRRLFHFNSMSMLMFFVIYYNFAHSIDKYIIVVD